MADKSVSVELKGKDSLSPVFQKVGQAATAAGKTIDAAGKSVQTFDKESTTAAQSMSRFEQATAKAQQATGKLGISAETAGKAIGTAVTAGLLLSVKAAADAEVSQQRLQSSIEATGALYEQYASQVAAVNNQALHLSFDDEDAQDALSGLIQATGDVDQSLQQMGLAEDIARGRGIDLASATKIVIAADQERFGALQRLGIQLGDNATKESALAALQQKYAGQAETYASTNAGAFDRWKNAVENAAESVGAFMGPAQQLLLIFPGLAAGATAAATAMTALGGTGAALSGLLGILTGPVGLAAAFAATALVMDEFGKKGDGKTAEEVWDDTAKGAEHLRTVMAALAASGATDLYNLGESGSTALTGLMSDFQRWQDLSKSVDAGTTMEDFGLTAEQAQGQMQDYLDTYGSLSNAAEDFSSAQNDLAKILADTGIGASEAQAETQELIAQWQNGEITADVFMSDLSLIATTLGDYDVAATKAAGATDKFAASMDAFQIRAVNHLDDTARSMAAMGALSPKMGTPGDTGAFDQQINSTKASANAAKAAQDGLAQGITNAANAMTYQVGEAQKLDDYYQDFKDKIPDATAAMTDAFNNVQTAVTGTTKALDSGYQVVVGNTQAIADSSQQVQDWATDLINVQGQWGKIDDLLGRNIISQDEYTAAQAAYTPIAEANARIQDDVLKIQTDQAPVLAGLAQAQADYMDSLANAPAEQQTFALAMMDSATSAEALQLATSLLGENGDVFAPMVEQAANLNPYLATILEQMGLIEQQPDGTWKVTVDSSDAESAFDNITGAIDKLNQTELLLVALLDDDPFTNTAADVEAKLNSLNDETATPTVSLNDNASAGLGSIASLLAGLGDKTITVTTVNQTIQSTLNPFENGGTVPAMANGGTSAYGYSRAAKNGLTATLVGERGPEVLMLPGGAQVMNTQGSRERWGNGSPQVVINISGPINGYDDLSERLMRDVSQAIVRANQIHERSVR